jgi:hypothetical protein
MQVKTVSPQQVLAQAIKLLERYPRLLETTDEAEQTDKAILDLLDLSRSMPPKLTIKPEPVPLHQVETPLAKLDPEMIEAARLRAEEERKADIKRVEQRRCKRRKLLQGEINKTRPVLSLDDLFA